MKYLPVFTVLLSLSFFCNRVAECGSIRITIPSGKLHLNGKLKEGACVISSDSREMHIDMGHYTTNNFTGVGSVARFGVPFSVRLTGCRREIAENIGITFTGMEDPKAPDLFRVTTADDIPSGVTGKDGYSGLGLMISDPQGNQLVPGRPPVFRPVTGREMVLHYVARYRATSRQVWPGLLHSEVWFDIVYP